MDRMVKQKFNIILVVDTSKSMGGKRIQQVNNAICDISKYLKELQVENTNVDFYLSILKFGTDANWHTEQIENYIDDFKFEEIKTKGQSNLGRAYEELNKVMLKESQGGIMPDFGGVAPIVILLTDGHPSDKYQQELELLKKKPWFKAALKYGIAIELNDLRTMKVLKEFVDGNGDVIEVYNPKLLEQIIKIIVLTVSKVKSKTMSSNIASTPNVVIDVKQTIAEALNDIEEWEW